MILEHFQKSKTSCKNRFFSDLWKLFYLLREWRILEGWLMIGSLGEQIWSKENFWRRIMSPILPDFAQRLREGHNQFFRPSLHWLADESKIEFCLFAAACLDDFLTFPLLKIFSILKYHHQPAGQQT